MSVRDYGDLTPRELFLIMDEYNGRRQQQREDMITGAYLTAYWQRIDAKKMPSLQKVLEDARPKIKAEQTDAQMLAIAMRLQAQFTGGEG